MERLNKIVLIQQFYVFFSIFWCGILCKNDTFHCDFQFDPISVYEDSVANHLSKILHSEDHSIVISSAK